MSTTNTLRKMNKIYHDNQRYRMHTISMSVEGGCVVTGCAAWGLSCFFDLFTIGNIYLFAVGYLY